MGFRDERAACSPVMTGIPRSITTTSGSSCSTFLIASRRCRVPANFPIRLLLFQQPAQQQANGGIVIGDQNSVGMIPPLHPRRPDWRFFAQAPFKAQNYEHYATFAPAEPYSKALIP